MSKIVLIVEGGCVQNILTDELFDGDIFMLDHDIIIEDSEFANLDKNICMNMNYEVNKDEVEKILSMTYREYLEENYPKLLEELEKELKEFEEEQWGKRPKKNFGLKWEIDNV